MKPLTGPLMNTDTNDTTIALITSVTTSSISVKPDWRVMSRIGSEPRLVAAEREVDVLRMGHAHVHALRVRARDARERGARGHRHGDRVEREPRNRVAELIAHNAVYKTVVVVDVVEITATALDGDAVGIDERLEHDLLEVGLADRDGLAQNHRVRAATRAARQKPEHGARRDRDDDDRNHELDQRHSTFADCAHG